MMFNCNSSDSQIQWNLTITVDFGEVKTPATECKEKCFQMMSSSYLHYSKAPQNVLMLMIHLKKRSLRGVIYEVEIQIESVPDDFKVTTKLQPLECDCDSTVVKARILLVYRNALS